jgi:hypothetical protein
MSLFVFKKKILQLINFHLKGKRKILIHYKIKYKGRGGGKEKNCLCKLI